VNWQDRSWRPIPDSEDLTMPRWSPDGRWIAALGDENTEMRLYDVAQRKWKSLARGRILGLPVWSADSAYLYFQRPAEPGQPLVRVRLSSGGEEAVASFQSAIDAGATTCTFLNLSPDGHPIVNQASASDIYGATLVAP
jgi:Tol biopolymer transport system component